MPEVSHDPAAEPSDKGWCNKFGRRHGGSAMAFRLFVGITLTAVAIAIGGLIAAMVFDPDKGKIVGTIGLIFMGVAVLADALITCLYLKLRYAVLMLLIGIVTLACSVFLFALLF